MIKLLSRGDLERRLASTELSKRRPDLAGFILAGQAKFVGADGVEVALEGSSCGDGTITRELAAPPSAPVPSSSKAPDPVKRAALLAELERVEQAERTPVRSLAEEAQARAKGERSSVRDEIDAMFAAHYPQGAA